MLNILNYGFLIAREKHIQLGNWYQNNGNQDYFNVRLYPLTINLLYYLTIQEY